MPVYHQVHSEFQSVRPRKHTAFFLSLVFQRKINFHIFQFPYISSRIILVAAICSARWGIFLFVVELRILLISMKTNWAGSFPFPFGIRSATQANLGEDFLILPRG